MTRAIIVALALAIAVTPASAGRWTCGQVKWAAEHFSQAALDAWGDAIGVSAQERAEARKCLGLPLEKPKDHK